MPFCCFSIIDTVVVVRNVGIQLSTEKWGGFKQSRFIPHSDVHDIIIHEAITMVRYYLNSFRRSFYLPSSPAQSNILPSSITSHKERHATCGDQ